MTSSAPRLAPAPSLLAQIAGVAAAVGSVALLASCQRPVTTQRDVAFDQPRVAGGVILAEDDDPVDVEQIADALDKMLLGLPDPTTLATRVGTPMVTADPIPMAALDQSTVSTDPIALSHITRSISERIPAPENATQIHELPPLSDIEVRELIDRLALSFAVKGYEEADTVLADQLPYAPDGVAVARALARPSDAGVRTVRLGYRTFVSQPPMLWIQGLEIAEADAALLSNPDLEDLAPQLTALTGTLDQMRQGLTVRDLGAEMVQLSYIDATAAIEMLDGLGVTTMKTTAEVPDAVEFTKLPYVVLLPDPKKEDVGLVGQASVAKGEFGVSLTPSIASELNQQMIASPLTRLMVLYHPAHPGQFSMVRELIDDYVDRPARQIFVEGIVLEISEDGLEDLGVEWEFREGPFQWSFGSSSATGIDDTLNVEGTRLDDFIYDWDFKLRALVREGKAEVLARPSVLTLNNRQSTIRVGQDIPIATSQEGTSFNSNKIAFNFKYLATGILLNIRPRINEAGTEVSMLIDTIVSAVVPGADLEIRSVDDELLARAPTVSTRRVQTYGRIQNNTPFIIGGLISRETTTSRDKVPVLGDIPLLGGLFQSQRMSSTKTEVIIVLTPYVLPDEHILSRSIPKDADNFDSFGNSLFRDAYRIRGEDVFDLRFLVQNKRLTTYRQLARDVLARDFTYAQKLPFSEWADDRIPGEGTLVTRMIYEVIKRLDTASTIPVDRMILLEEHQSAGYSVRFLEPTMAKIANTFRGGQFFDVMKDRALAITYHYDRESVDPERLASEPIPELAVLDCPDRDTWAQLLWDLNQPAADGRQRYTILLHSPSDLVRLQRAIALKRVAVLNGGDQGLRLRNFSIGKVLLMPGASPQQVHVIDAEVARYFFHTEHYYAAMLQEIERELVDLDQALRDPAVMNLLGVDPDSLLNND